VPELAAVSSASRVAVPYFVGRTVRQVTEQAAASGFGVQVIGSGIAREQAPAAGTLAPAGAEVIVRFTR
jgi:cell division protein FtsI (penicillin-binding protein 3)